MGRSDSHEGTSTMNLMGKIGDCVIQHNHLNAFATFTTNLPPHYIFSLHGFNLNLNKFKEEFNTNKTYAVRNIEKLSETIKCDLESKYKNFNFLLQWRHISYYSHFKSIVYADKDSPLAWCFNDKKFACIQSPPVFDFFQKEPHFSYQK